MAKSNHKLLYKVAEERNLKPGKIIYIDISSQKKPGYGGSKNLILTEDSDTKHKLSLFTNTKEDLSENFTPLLKKMKTMKENVIIVCC